MKIHQNLFVENKEAQGQKESPVIVVVVVVVGEVQEKNRKKRAKRIMRNIPDC
jgi:hypothetical protein